MADYITRRDGYPAIHEDILLLNGGAEGIEVRDSFAFFDFRSCSVCRHAQTKQEQRKCSLILTYARNKNNTENFETKFVYILFIYTSIECVRVCVHVTKICA